MAASESCTWVHQIFALCENFQARTSKNSAKKCPTRITTWPEAAHYVLALRLTANVRHLDSIDTGGGRVKQKLRNKIHLGLRLEIVGTEIPNLEVKSLIFLSREELVGDLALFIFLSFYFLFKATFSWSLCFQFLHEILTGLLETSCTIKTEFCKKGLFSVQSIEEPRIYLSCSGVMFCL